MIAELNQLIANRIVAKPNQIQEYCQRWKIAELSLFGDGQT